MVQKTAEVDYEDETKTPDEEKYYEKVRKEFRWDLTAHDNYIKDFDAYEAMLLSKPYDSISKKVQSGISDGRTTTIYLERAGRVAGKLPDGEVLAAGEQDDGVAAVLEILRTKWMQPNANAQKKFLKKVRLWQFNSSVYGFMPMYYDWNVTDNYVGPDCWLWHPRNFIPQVGRASIDEMDYAHGITYVGESFFEDCLEDDDEAGWDKAEVQRVIDMIHDSEKSVDVNNQRNSLVTRTRQYQAEKGRIMIATRYESGKDGKWVVFCPDYAGIVLRETPNPHKNGKIPFIIKYAVDLFDNVYGLGDFQRAKPLQFANDGLDNFYFAGIRRALYPATIVNPAGVVKSSITQDPGAIWQETVPNSIREYKTAPAGLATYQAAKGVINGAQAFQAGTTKTDVSASSAADPQFSRTDRGVGQQQQQEDTRDSQDRFELETALEELEDRMLGLIPVIGTESIPLDLFTSDIKQLVDSGYADSLAALVEKKHLSITKSGQSAHLVIPSGYLNDLTIRFKMEYDSTIQPNKTAQLAALDEFIKDMTSMQNEMTEMKNQGMTIDWKMIAEIKGRLAGVPELGKIFRPMTPQEQQAYQQSQAAAQQPPQQTMDDRMIDSTNYKDLPAWAQSQWLTRQGYKDPSGQGDVTTTDQKLKAQEVATKMHSAVHSTPEMAAESAPAPAAPAGPEAPDLSSEPLSLASHGSTPIVDPELALLHNHIGSLIKDKVTKKG